LCRGLKAQDITSPRFFKFNYHKLSAPNRFISPEGNTSAKEENGATYLLETQLFLPISVRGKTLIVSKLEFEHESVFGLQKTFDNQIDFDFNSFSFQVIGFHSISEKYKYVSRLKYQIGAEDFFPVSTQAFSYSYSHVFQKVVKDGEIGLGIQISYSRRLSFLPLIKYEKGFGNGWGIDLFLPQQIFISKQFTQRNKIYAGLTGSRSNYLIRPGLLNENSTYYRRITVNSIIGFEKQLNPLFGMMIEGGVTKNLRSGIYTIENRWNRLHNFRDSFEPYLKLGLFMSVDGLK